MTGRRAYVGRNETLARAIHEDYVRKQAEEGRTPADNPSMVPWGELPEHLRESNRRQADDIEDKLRAVGSRIAPRAGERDAFAFDRVEVELLAHVEHDRWWREREIDGWRYAPEKDVERKESPYLVPWEELPEDVRELDRNAVRTIPDVLARAGLRVVRAQEEEGPWTRQEWLNRGPSSSPGT